MLGTKSFKEGKTFPRSVLLHASDIVAMWRLLAMDIRWPGLSLVGLAVAWLCTGCIPIRFTTSPGARGKVVDVVTHSPVQGAELVVSRSTYPPDSPDKAFAYRRAPVVMSQQDGQFSIPLERRLDLYFVPVDVFPRFGLLVVRCQGYETTCVPFWSRSVAELGEIQVKPGP